MGYIYMCWWIYGYVDNVDVCGVLVVCVMCGCVSCVDICHCPGRICVADV